MVANTLPAINDITAPELRALLSAASQHCPIIYKAREAAIEVGLTAAGTYSPCMFCIPHYCMPLHKC